MYLHTYIHIHVYAFYIPGSNADPNNVSGGRVSCFVFKYTYIYIYAYIHIYIYIYIYKHMCSYSICQEATPNPATCLEGLVFALHATKSNPMDKDVLSAKIAAAGGKLVVVRVCVCYVSVYMSECGCGCGCGCGRGCGCGYECWVCVWVCV